MTFSTTSASAASRTISWQVSDGTLKSAAATSTVNVIAVSPDAGRLRQHGELYGGRRGGGTLDAGLTVSDPSSSTLSGATVLIASGFLAGDALNFANQSGITGSYSSSTGVLTLTGTATPAQYQTALESVSFSSTNLNPTNYGADLTRAINWVGQRPVRGAIGRRVQLPQYRRRRSGADPVGRGQHHDLRAGRRRRRDR